MPTVRITGLPKTRLDHSGRLEVLADLEGVPDSFWANIYARAVNNRLASGVTNMTAAASVEHVMVSCVDPQQAEAALVAMVEEIGTTNALWDEAQKKLGEFKTTIDRWWSTNVPR